MISEIKYLYANGLNYKVNENKLVYLFLIIVLIFRETTASERIAGNKIVFRPPNVSTNSTDLYTLF